MKKSKVVLVLAALFCLSFLAYLNKLDSDSVNLEKNLLASPNIIDVTKQIETKIYVGPEDLSVNSNWTSKEFDDSKWKSVSIPHFFNAEKNFVEGNYGYYRIKVPAALMKDFKELKNEISLSLYFVLFNQLTYFVNGQLIRSNSPKGYNESIIVAPLDESKDNLIAIQGKIKAGDSGIDHRISIMLGKTSELNQLYTFAYKGQTISILMFILSKGSILFIFALIYFVVRTESFFEKFLMFGIFTIAEDVLTGDFVTSFLNLNQQIYLYDFVNVGIVTSLFLFLSDVTGKEFSKRKISVAVATLSLISAIVVMDVVGTNYYLNIMHFLKFWNIALMLVLAFFVPKLLKADKILAFIIVVAFCLTGWSTFFSHNVGHNLKAMGNLMLFFMAAYQTFLLFKREQDQLQEKSRQILEQEKDVAIGQTAAILAHDVRRPLEQMNLILNRISSGDFNEDFIRMAKRDVSFSITTVHNQINDIMNFSRNKKIQLNEVSFYTLLSGALKQVMTINQNVHIDLVYNFHTEKFVLADESLLASVLTNLVSNSIEAIRDIGKMTSGRIELTSEILNDEFVFTIFNNGPLIPESLIQDIFKPLFTHGKSKGTGLGLASASKILKEHGGSIEVFNRSEGVAFVLKLKVGTHKGLIDMNEFKKSSNDYSYAVHSNIPASKLPQVRILLLDDDAQVFEYFKFLVINLNFEVELNFASNFEEGAKKVAEKRYDLYILDYDLGDEQTGLDFYQLHLARLKTEVVIHSNREAINIPNIDCVFEQKPMMADSLLKHIDHALASALQLLVVDDSELTLMAWTMFHGTHNIKTFSLPSEAIEYSKNVDNKIDLCVLDYYFDNQAMTGDELGEEILKLRPGVDIVIASSSAPEGKFQRIEKSHFEVRSRLS